MAHLTKNLKKLFAEDSAKGIEQLEKRLCRLERQHYNLLNQLQRDRFANDLSAPDFQSQGFGVHSKQDEDGLILHILKNIGVQNRTFFEIGVQDGMECNTANLARNFGWSGVMFEGDEALADEARRNYCGFPKVSIHQAYVNIENIRPLLSEHGVDPSCDLFSLDIDGNDYWIWQALTDFQPRVVVVEYNHALGPVKSLTIRYDPEFQYRAKHPRGYMGASLRALVKLGAEKGYALVGSSNLGPNAFFVRRQLLAGDITEMSVEDAWRPLYLRRRGASFPDTLKDLNFLEV